GSRKRAGGRDYINTNEIGVLCALFDLEGVLCRLLDLIPEAIQKIASLKFDKDETLDFLEEMLKKTAQKTVGLIYDELVNGIEMGAFCELEPPPLPEPVSFSDVFIFMAELVPILGYFFTVNEILTGESTQLLDKIVGFWLREQWFLNCECIPSEPPTELPPAPPTEPPLDIPDCADNCPPRPCTVSVTICNGFFSNGQPIRPRSSCYGFRRVTFVTPPTQIEQGWSTAYIGANEVDIPQNDVLPASESFTDVAGYSKPPLFANFGDGWFEVSEPPAFSGYIAPCPPCFDEEIEGTKEFCALFPDDPICLPDGDNEGDCGIEYVFVEEFIDCGLPTRSVRFTLNVNGRDVPVTVSEFSECDSDRTDKEVSLFECINGVDVFGCNDPEATNYNPDVTINNGTCEYPEAVYGCTDPEALNYNPDAEEDDGSCVYEVFGCTD
ncbi:hypothetical protein B9G53_03365, partial [Pseudanabaena sp. SR411]|uniref:hypothetical protein n=1 Tax=Pseudanabaena sp. SR411 TaxID=1980935 RepID=UPI000BC63BC0